MENQITTRNLIFNKDKNIGTIILVVEGTSEEYRLFKYIFTKILDYNYITIRKNKVITDYYQSKSNNNSKIIISNTSNSNIGSIMEDGYIDKLYKILLEEYQESIKNTPIYFIWDRDKDSNFCVKQLLNVYGSSIDNGYNINGLLLLSYPCLEVFELSLVNKRLYKTYLDSSNIAKKLKK